MILGFTNCSIDLVDDVCVFVVVVFNVVVVVVVVVEGVSKFFSFLEMNNFEVVFLELGQRFASNNPKIYPKSDNTRRRTHTRHSKKSQDCFRNGPFHVLTRYKQRGAYNNEI